MNISSFRIRASYPNFFMVNLYAREGREIFNHDSEDPDNQLEGNKPGTVIYRLQGDDTPHEFPPRWYDMYRLLKLRDAEQRQFLELLLLEHNGEISETQRKQLEDIRDTFHRYCREFVENNTLTDSDELITTLTQDADFTDEAISYKGHMLLDLTRNCYPVPDFVILTAKSFNNPDHLPELNLGLDLLKEDQVEDFWHVNAGVKHINGDGNLRHLSGHTEIVDKVLGVCNLIVNQHAEIAAVFRIQVCKAMDNELGVVVVVGKDDGLANLLATIYHLTAGHQVREHLVHGIDVEDIVEYLARSDVPGRIRFLIKKHLTLGHLVLPDILHLLLLFIGKVFIADTFLHNLGGLGEPGRRHQIVFIDGLAQFVSEVGLAAFQTEKVVGATVHVFTRCGG